VGADAREDVADGAGAVDCLLTEPVVVRRVAVELPLALVELVIVELTRCKLWSTEWLAEGVGVAAVLADVVVTGSVPVLKAFSSTGRHCSAHQRSYRLSKPPELQDHQTAELPSTSELFGSRQ
jgi:hypothetical protein